MKQRRSIRMSGYDYSNCGYYFVTIDVQDKLKLFWDAGEVNHPGKMIEKCWLDLKGRFGVELDEYVVMPDHFHGIVVIPWRRAPIKGARTLDPNVGVGFMPTQDIALDPNVGVGFMPTQDNNDIHEPKENNHQQLGEIIGVFKSISTGIYIKGISDNNWPRFNKRLWQRNYYERIIRNEAELNRIRNYIICNPAKWRCQ